MRQNRERKKRTGCSSRELYDSWRGPRAESPGVRAGFRKEQTDHQREDVLRRQQNEENEQAEGTNPLGDCGRAEKPP